MKSSVNRVIERINNKTIINYYCSNCGKQIVYYIDENSPYGLKIAEKYFSSKKYYCKKCKCVLNWQIPITKDEGILYYERFRNDFEN